MNWLLYNPRNNWVLKGNVTLTNKPPICTWLGKRMPDLASRMLGASSVYPPSLDQSLLFVPLPMILHCLELSTEGACDLVKMESGGWILRDYAGSNVASWTHQACILLVKKGTQACIPPVQGFSNYPNQPSYSRHRLLWLLPLASLEFS